MHTNDAQLLTLLDKGLAHYNLPATLRQKEQLCKFLFVLSKWNKVYNLTAINNIEDMLIKHIFDSLAVVPFLSATGKILDVGTGAGLPGLPLSIIRSDLEFVLLDSSRKKTSFLNFVVASLGLTNITVVNARVEHYQTKEYFNMIVSRAFADLTLFVTSCAHLCHQDGFFLAMKGKSSQAKTEPLPSGYLLTKIETVMVPFLDGERCLVFISKKDNY